VIQVPTVSFFPDQDYDRDVRKLAELQGAITAIEDVITDEKSEE
jgi:hypothetical protein